MFLFGRKKPGASSPVSSVEVSAASRLQELCGGNEELYRALSSLMFLDPKKIPTSFENVLNEAREFEEKGNSLRAEVGYRVAGGISLYKGDVEGVKTHFSKAASVAGNSHPEYKTMARLAGEATNVARKYYESSDSVKI